MKRRSPNFWANMLFSQFLLLCKILAQRTLNSISILVLFKIKMVQYWINFPFLQWNCFRRSITPEAHGRSEYTQLPRSRKWREERKEEHGEARKEVTVPSPQPYGHSNINYCLLSAPHSSEFESRSSQTHWSSLFNRGQLNPQLLPLRHLNQVKLTTSPVCNCYKMRFTIIWSTTRS